MSRDEYDHLRESADAETLPQAAGSGTPPTITAVGAGETEPPFEDLFRVIDRMRRSEIRPFLRKLRRRFPTDYTDVERGW